jgi:hypothetical protein
MSWTHTIAKIDTEKNTANLQTWECSENLPLGVYFRELTRGGESRFWNDEQGTWLVIKRQTDGTFTMEFGEPAG